MEIGPNENPTDSEQKKKSIYFTSSSHISHLKKNKPRSDTNRVRALAYNVITKETVNYSIFSALLMA